MTVSKFKMTSLISVLLCVSVTGISATDLQNNTSSCKGNVTNFKNEPVSVKEYCTPNNTCVIKCCGENEVFTDSKRTCTNVNNLDLASSNITLDYSDLKIYSSNIQDDIVLTKKKFKDFNLVQNRVFVDNQNCSTFWRTKLYDGYVLENGEFAGYMRHQFELWKIKKALSFCVELVVYKPSRTSSSYNSTYLYYYTLDVDNQATVDASPVVENNFAGAATLISAFFLLLMLLVYCVLPQLQNLSGMLIMVYVATLAAAYFLKAICVFTPNIPCKVIGPTMYFLYVSSFLWLNIISFDIWWTFRGMRLKRAINRQGEVVKFLWYCLFVWSVTGSMTIAAVLIDNAQLTNWPKVIKPQFDTCLFNVDANLLYLYTPIGIITLINVVLFLMTVYNMWVIKKLLTDFNSSNTNKNENRFRLYIKLSLLMGVSWVVEVIQSFYGKSKMSVGLYVILNLYNTLIGVWIFFMFVFNKTTLRLLCKRGMRLKRAINRQGEVVKFLWYCLFVWGVTTSMTVAGVLIDKAPLTDRPFIIKAQFQTCLYNKKSKLCLYYGRARPSNTEDANLLYLYTPIGIITLINVVLFLMTVYNMWVIKKLLTDFNSSNTSKKNQNRFRLYVKMSLLMGISWVVEVIQSIYDEEYMSLWFYVVLNLYNVLIGVAIFFLFIFNKSTLRMLCNRFNIKNKFLVNLNHENSTKTRTTMSERSVSKGSYSKAKTTEQSETEMTEVSIADGKNDYHVRR